MAGQRGLWRVCIQARHPRSQRFFIRSRSRLVAGNSGVRLRVQAPCSDGDRARPRLMNHEASLYSPDLLYTCDHMPPTVATVAERAAPLPRKVASAVSGLACASLRSP